MNSETFFEELESQLLEDRRCLEWQKHIASSNRLSLRVAGVEFSLVAPILGRDFVVGFCERRTAWMCFGKHKVSLLRFVADADSQLPKLRIRSSSLIEFVGEMKPPFAAELKPTGEPAFITAITAAEQGFIYFKPPGQHEPLSALGLKILDWLIIIESPDANALSEWRNR